MEQERRIKGDRKSAEDGRRDGRRWDTLGGGNWKKWEKFHTTHRNFCNTKTTVSWELQFLYGVIGNWEREV